MADQEDNESLNSSKVDEAGKSKSTKQQKGKTGPVQDPHDVIETRDHAVQDPHDLIEILDHPLQDSFEQKGQDQ